MTTDNPKSATCLCGNVTLIANKVEPAVDACHCNMCRKWAGGPLLSVDCGSDVTIKGKEHTCSYSSSDWAERSFCSKCGTHLFYRLKKQNQYIVPAGLFDNIDKLELKTQIFIDEKPDYYCFSNDTKNMTGEEVFAQYTE